jgi:DNA topoisomerase-1
VSEELANTPAICRKSYVHQTVVAAFENGKLAKFSELLKARRSPAHREQLLAQVCQLRLARHGGERARCI